MKKTIKIERSIKRGREHKPLPPPPAEKKGSSVDDAPGWMFGMAFIGIGAIVIGILAFVYSVGHR